MEWQKVRRLTPKQKGEILARYPGQFVLAKHWEYVLLVDDGKLSNYVLRRCPRCGYIAIVFRDVTVEARCPSCKKVAEF